MGTENQENKVVSNNEESEKKHNKLVGWFMALPKLVKILLIGGSLAAIATAITVPIVLLNQNNVTVNETEFDNAVKLFKAASLNDAEDNRNCEIQVNGKYVVNGVTANLTYSTKYEKNFIACKLEQTVGELKTSRDYAYHYLGDGVYQMKSKEDEQDEKVNIANTFENGALNEDFISLLGIAQYKLSDFSYANGNYTGNLNIEIGATKAVFPSTINFGTDKKIKTLKIKANKQLLYGEEIDADFTCNFSNYGSTSTGLNESNFPNTIITYDGSVAEVTQEFENLHPEKVIIIRSTVDKIKNKKLTFKYTTDGSSYIGAFNYVFTNGNKINSLSSVISLSEYESKLGNNIYISSLEEKNLAQNAKFTIGD